MNKRMRGEGADRAPVGLVRSVGAICRNVRAIRDRGNIEPPRRDVSYQPFPGLTER
jgi:hypothetical protein